MGRLTPPCSPAFTTRTTTTTTIGGGSGLSLIHSINAFCAKLIKRSSSAKKSPKSAPAKARGPKHLLMTLSNKVIIFKHKKKIERHDGDDDEGEIDGGLWQKGILLGDKCQPPDFSGVIYYDIDGNQLPEFPMKSPRASPLPSYLYGTPAK